MEYSDIKPLIDSYHRRIAHVSLDFKRYLYDTINWNASIIGIKGAKGVGKTTMLLQRIREKYSNIDDTIYFSLDDMWFKTHSLMELVDFLYTHGIEEMYIDEVHKTDDWGRILKNLYDSYPGIRIVYTGSSMLQIDSFQSDLGRRQTLYTLGVMSFREYLEYEGIANISPIPLASILSDHVNIATSIIGDVKILKHFEDYLSHGCYPFYKDESTDFQIRLKTSASLVIETDLPAVAPITYETVDKTKKLFMIISENVPFQPKIENLSEALASTRDSCIRMLYLLDSASLLFLLTTQLKNYKRLVKPDKIYLGNTNLMNAFSKDADRGNIRETFFANQLSMSHTLQYPTKGDFSVDGKYLFEVGGPGKDFRQIANLPDSFLATDGVETGYGNRIPLWMFGLMY